MTKFDRVSASTLVSLDPATAFRVFTEEIDAWWRREPRFRFDAERSGVLRIEPRVGGRFVEDFADGDPFEIGHVVEWEPGEKVAFDFRALSFEPGQRTRVEVRFEPAAGGTRVTVEHSGWDSIPTDHPARRGLRGLSFKNMQSGWWAELLGSLARLYV